VDRVEAQPTIDELLDRAVAAINRDDRATSDVLARQVPALDERNQDAQELPAAERHGFTTMTTFVDTLRALDAKVLSTCYDGLIARTLIAAADPIEARARVNTALGFAEETGMHFYDA